MHDIMRRGYRADNSYNNKDSTAGRSFEDRTRQDNRYEQQNDRPWLIKRENNQPSPPGTSDMKIEVKGEVDFNADQVEKFNYDEDLSDSVKSETYDSRNRGSVKQEQGAGCEIEEEEEEKFFCGVCEHTSYSLEVYMFSCLINCLAN